MDTQIINPFLIATIEVFDEMFNYKAECGKPFIQKLERGHRWEVSGIIGIVGDSEGILVLRLTKSFAMKLVQATGLEYQDEEEFEDLLRGLIGELVNIISGKAISKLLDKDVDITPPITIQGINHSITWPNLAPIIALPFFTPHGSFEVQISVT